MKINKQLCLKRLVSPAPTYTDAKSLPILIWWRMLYMAVISVP